MKNTLYCMYFITALALKNPIIKFSFIYPSCGMDIVFYKLLMRKHSFYEPI